MSHKIIDYKETTMKKALIVLTILLFAGWAVAAEINVTETWTAVTPDGKETEIGKVKVQHRVVVEAPDEMREKLGLGDGYLVNEMYRLELIDEQLADLQARISKLQEEKAALQAIRTQVEAEAKKVQLKEKEPKPEPEPVEEP